MEPRDLLAAGAVVVRDRGRQVLVVHRPKYDDWSFPKGKLDPGEHLTTAAVREVEEESGVRIRLGRPLPEQRYGIGNGRMKVVHYWVGHPVSGEDVENYSPNAEVDEVRWVGWHEASQLLSYRRDRHILAAAEPHAVATSTLVVLRHGKAVPRKEHTGDDRARALQAEGVEQAHAVVELLSAYGVTRVHSSTSTRCLDTVLPYVHAHGLGLKAHDYLSEEGEDAERIAALVTTLAKPERSSVLCSHRPVIPAVLDALEVSDVRLTPGGCLILHLDGGSVVSAEQYVS